MEKSKILNRLKKITEHESFSPGVEKEDKYTRFWEGYRAALKDVLETDEKFPLPWE